MKELKDNHDHLLDKIQSVSKDAVYPPASETWDRLEELLDNNRPTEHRPYKIFGLTTDWRIAAGLLMLFGLGGLLLSQNNLHDQNQTAFQLEDLHTLQINPSYHTPHIDDATIPSALFMRADAPIRTIEEGSSEKKIVVKKEYGLG